MPPGTDIGIALLKSDAGIPVAVRLGTDDADDAHASLRSAGSTLHNAEVLRWDGMPPMFAFEDPDGNALGYLEDERTD